MAEYQIYLLDDDRICTRSSPFKDREKYIPDYNNPVRSAGSGPHSCPVPVSYTVINIPDKNQVYSVGVRQSGIDEEAALIKARNAGLKLQAR